MRIITCALLITALVSVHAAADDREVQVNAYTTDATFLPVVEALDDGGFVVVWRGDDPIGSDLTIMSRRLDSQALPVGDEFRVDIATSGFSISTDPEIQKLSDGRFVVSWRRFSDPTFRFMSSDGMPIGGEVEVADLLVSDQTALAPAPDGGFLLAWDCLDFCAGDGWDTFAQRFDSTGQALTAPAFVNVVTSEAQQSPEAISLGNDGFLVVWRDAEGISDSLKMRRLDVDGEFVGGETELDVPIDDFVGFAVAGEGDRLVAAFSEFSEPERETMSVFRFDTFGNRIGQEFVVSAGFPYQLVVERVNINASGLIDLVGRKVALAGSNNLNRDVVAFQFDFDTGLQASNFQVNSLRVDNQYRADSVRTDSAFLIVWSSEGSFGDDTDRESIQARSSFEGLFFDDFESGRLEQWHESLGEPESLAKPE